jgi:hypothetical protein
MVGSGAADDSGVGVSCGSPAVGAGAVDPGGWVGAAEGSAWPSGAASVRGSGSPRAIVVPIAQVAA